jgi:phospho-2-dehydro-3-deoxyheptonate aldolase
MKMAIYAPEIPNITELEKKYPLSQEAARNIELARLAVGTALRGDGFLGIIGPCAMTEDRATIEHEGDILHELEGTEQGLVLVHRKPPWKPRTNPEDWHGLETTNPEAAYRTIAERALTAANVAIEIGHIPHLRRYGRFITFGWSGSRNAEDVVLTEEITHYDSSLPIGVKNSMDGTIDQALMNVARITDVRGSNEAPAVLIYRGGSNARTPKAWEDNYRRAHERTNGQLVVDTAHGGEMAHNPKGEYAKSIIGQIACIEHVINVAAKGEMPVGIMMEASDAASPTDPLVPFNVAIEGIRELNEIRRKET